jgi:ketosteroid isomerase-like protein
VPRKTSYLFLVLTLLLSGCIKKKEVTYVSDETLIRQQIAHFEEAIRQKNPNLFSDYYARDKIVVFPLWEQDTLSSWEEVSSYWKDFFNTHDVADFFLGSVTVNTSGRTAWVKGKWEMKLEKKRLLKKKKQYYDLKGRYTTIFENKEGHWQVVHEHMSTADLNLVPK